MLLPEWELYTYLPQKHQFIAFFFLEREWIFLEQSAFSLKPPWFLFFFSLNSLTPREFNSYGSRRGNDAVMARGTFANIRLVNKFIDKQGPQTIHFPSGEIVSIHTALNCVSLTTEWISAGFLSYQLRFLLQYLLSKAYCGSRSWLREAVMCTYAIWCFQAYQWRV